MGEILVKIKQLQVSDKIQIKIKKIEVVVQVKLHKRVVFIFDRNSPFYFRSIYLILKVTVVLTLTILKVTFLILPRIVLVRIPRTPIIRGKLNKPGVVNIEMLVKLTPLKV